MSKVSSSYREGLLEDLRMPSEAAAYLNAALEDGSYDGFLMAVRDVTEAVGMSWFPEQVPNRQKKSHTTVSENDADLSNLFVLLKNMDLELAVKEAVCEGG